MHKVMKFMAVGLLALSACAAAKNEPEKREFRDRLVLIREDVADNDSLQRILKILDKAKEGEFTGILWDGGIHGEGFDFHRFNKERTERARQVQARCSELGLDIYPVLWSIGRAFALVDYDPSFAEGLPIKNVPYVAKNGKAVFDGVKESFDPGFGVTNNTIRAKNGKITNSERSIEVFQKLKPCRLYRCTAKVLPKGIKGKPGYPLWVGWDLHVESLRPNHNRAERETAIMLKTDSDEWMDVCLDFVTVETGETYIIFMADYASLEGTMYVKDVQLRELGLQKLVVRSGAPVIVRDAKTKKEYIPGKDYIEPKCWISPHEQTPHDNPADPDWEIELVEGGAIKEGTKLLIDAYVMARRSNEQIGACMSNPKLYEYFDKSARAACKLFGQPKGWFLQMDEIRAGNTCLDCERRHTDMGHIMVDCLKKQCEILTKYSPKSDIFFWPDMLDPNCNSAEWRRGKDFFLCKGGFHDALDLIPEKLIPCPWMPPSRGGKESMEMYSKMGKEMIYACYYDVTDLDAERNRGSIEFANTIPGCRGIVYTTFGKHYDQLVDFGKLVRKLENPLPAKGK